MKQSKKTRRFRNASGPLIRKLRKERGWTQDQLAAKLSLKGLENFDQMVIAKLEGQYRSIFDFELMIIAEVLNIDLADLKPTKSEFSAALPDLQHGLKEN